MNALIYVAADEATATVVLSHVALKEKKTRNRKIWQVSEVSISSVFLILQKH